MRDCEFPPIKFPGANHPIMVERIGAGVAAIKDHLAEREIHSLARETFAGRRFE